MTILHLIGTGDFAGTEQMVLTICRGQIRRGHRVMVATRERGRIEQYLRQEGIDIIEPKIGPATAPFHVSRVCRRQGVEILHSHLTSGTHVANAVSVLTGIPVVNHLHVYNRDVGYAISSHLGVMMAVSKHTETYYRGRPFVRKQSLITVPNGSSILSDADAKLQRQTAQGVMAEELGLPATTRFVTLAGRLTHQKGHDLFLNAVREISPRFPDVHYLMLGSMEDSSFVAVVRQMISDFGLHERVHILGFRRDIAKVLRASSVSVVPSRYDPFPLSVIESMLIGTPMVATRVGGIPESISRPEFGTLIDSEDWPSMATAIAAYLDDEMWANRVAKAAQEEAILRFSVDAMLDRIDDAYAQAIGVRRRARVSAAKG